MSEWYSYIVGEANRQQLDNWVTLLSQINVKIAQMGNSETNGNLLKSRKLKRDSKLTGTFKLIEIEKKIKASVIFEIKNRLKSPGDL